MIRIGLFSFLKFWKKKDKNEDLPGLMGNNIMPGFEPSLKPATEFRNITSINSAPYNDQGQDYGTQLILSRLELINSRLQNIEQKVALIEQIAKQSQEPEQKWQPRKIY